MEIVQAQLSFFQNEYQLVTPKHASKRITRKISEVPTIAPVVEILEEVIEPPQKDVVQIDSSIKNSLAKLFPEQQYEDKDIQKTKEILGNTARDLDEEQIKNTINEIKFLVTTWLDEYEKNLFDGLTLTELLHEKGGL